ncbi:MAG: 3-dehydroquinate dehydratase [Candidatus Shikimatogenerans bostrichidophilus]|nr:MAG: 3-dehydroquinate dehydratase [Candidatus Shikimatogenerans bostrichidophilus]
MKNNILIINGPNINKIGNREKKIYGKVNINEYLINLKKKFLKKKYNIKIYNSNSESKIIDILYKKSNIKNIIGIIINLGAYSHTSLAISDTIRSIKNKLKIIEVHISNIFIREDIRHKSLISPYCKGIIIGLGIKVYKMAILSLILK